MRNVEFEVVQYRTNEMIHASKNLIYNFAQYSGISGTEMWPRMIYKVAEIIHNQLPQQYTWQTPGLNIGFSGIPQAELWKVQDELVCYADEPYFALQEGVSYDLRPALRTHIQNVTQAIIDEMQDVYKMEVVKDQSAFLLKFPKQSYAQKLIL